MMTPERFKKVFGGDWNGEQVEVNQEPDKQDKQFLRILKLLEKNDPTFLDRSAIYFEKYYDSIFTIMDNPYTLAYVEIGDALKKAEKIAENNDDALLLATLCPWLEKCYSLGINWKTDYNATLTALDVYIVAAKTGKLPTELPQSTYIDHFSGKPFIYEITNDGFTLRCQQEDLSKKTTHEFTYKLPK